jgi:pimeloyl-ACP methyl ester carboxylesterase
MQSFTHIGGRFILIMLIISLVFLFILSGILFRSSPGKAKPFLDENGKLLSGSISEKAFIDINGVKQGMFIKGKDTTKPVLLYLHGGMPEYFLTRKYPTGLENYFIVVWWEQRGSGLSYSTHIPPNTLTLEQMISDTKEVTNYLRKRFRRDKIYLMGHSGGTFIGIQAAAQFPELFYAYIGMSQMSFQLKSEELAREYMLRAFRENGNTAMTKKLMAAAVSIKDGVSKAYLALRDPAMHPLGIGTTHDMHSVITGIMLPSWSNPEYTLAEKFNTWRGKARSGVSVLWNTMLTTDLSKQVLRLDIPVYFFEGIYDYTVSYTLAKEYFLKLQAPIKGFYTFINSAHSPLFEEPTPMQHILREDVLAGKNNLADTLQ